MLEFYIKISSISASLYSRNSTSIRYVDSVLFNVQSDEFNVERAEHPAWALGALHAYHVQGTKALTRR